MATKKIQAPKNAAPATRSESNGALPEQQVHLDEFNGNRMFCVQNMPFDRFPTSLGARKVRDVIRNIEEALKFLGDSPNDQDKQVARNFWAKFNRKSK